MNESASRRDCHMQHVVRDVVRASYIKFVMSGGMYVCVATSDCDECHGFVPRVCASHLQFVTHSLPSLHVHDSTHSYEASRRATALQTRHVFVPHIYSS